MRFIVPYEQAYRKACMGSLLNPSDQIEVTDMVAEDRFLKYDEMYEENLSKRKGWKGSGDASAG